MATNIGKIQPAPIIEEMQKSYLDYAMSVIVSRALPDVRDGLKPVQRRIIYAMHQQGMHHTSRYQKSAAVVGEVLKHYHPHGDAPVYEAMVRMAQNFSMRYMLVDGQGNFGCFTKDTKVKLTDGRNLSFEELIREQERGRRHWTFSFNTKDKKIEIAEIKNPRLTRRNSQLVEIKLDNGERIRCTHDHRFMLRNGTYKQAKDLQQGESLMPIYLEEYDGAEDKNLKDYKRVYQQNQDKWEFIHHLADLWNLNQGIYPRSSRKKFIDENKDFLSERATARNHKMWQDPEFRKLMSETTKRSWKDPKYREDRKKDSSENLKRLWQKKEFRLLLSELKLKELKKRWQDPNYKTQAMRSKILRYTLSLIQKHSNLTPEIFNSERTNNYIPRYENAILYFSNLSNLINESKHYNHKVVNVVFLKETEDVYDITTEPWHNFALASGVFVHNSIDGDSPAAQRYTEARLSAISEELLRDINKNTVNFIDNYSGTIQEPVLLPSVIPSLLLNGASGIAVGMATQIPPHNLGEVCDALIFMIDHPENSVEDLLQFIKGPDFPTSASIYDQTEILAAYATGKGRIVMRARAEIDETPQGKMQIIVSELPFQVNKASLIARIAELVKDKKLDGIADLRDESDRKQMVRIVFDLKRDAKPQSILNNLYKHTSMQSVFNVNLVALSDGVPHLLTLKRILEEFILHRQIIVRKRSEFELSEAKAREHILEGLKIAVDAIDAVIKTIKESKDADTAKTNLMTKFGLTEIQAVAILDMQLRRLAALERQKIEDELKMIRETIHYLEDLLAHPEKILKVIKDELSKIKEKYGDDRRTRVYKQKVGQFSEEDLVSNEVTIATITAGGYIKRQAPMSFRTQQRGGKGVIGISTKETDAVSHIFYTQTHDSILFFTDKGRVFQIKVWEIPETGRSAKGQSIVNLINVEQGEKITAVLTTRQKGEIARYFFMCTKKGTVKKTSLDEYANIRKSGLVAIKLDQEDELGWVAATSGKDDLIIVSKNGKSIRFSESQVKPTHRDTSGVRGIRLASRDEVVSVNIVQSNNDSLLVITENGLGKKTLFSAWKRQGRGGQGVKAAQVTTKTGPIVAAQAIDEKMDTLVLTSTRGQLIKMNLAEVPTLQRQTQGVILMRVRPGEKVAAATVVSSKEKT